MHGEWFFVLGLLHYKYTMAINYRLKNSIPIKSLDKNGIQIEISINDKNEVCIVKNGIMVCINESSFSTS